MTNGIILSVNVLFIFVICTNCDRNVKYCEVDKYDMCTNKDNLNKRYILYDINPPEGFNLRRDVYIRIAVFIKKLVEEDPNFQWYLVLPPWGGIYHWQSLDVGLQQQLPWSTFFDIISLQKYIPVMEMYDFLQEYPSKYGKSTLDHVYILQNNEKMFKTGKFEDTNELITCIPNKIKYKKNKNEFIGYFWGFSNITAHAVDCIIFHGTISGLKTNLEPTLHKSVMFDHMEVALHNSYGSYDYWCARRSMRYSTSLYEIAKKFRIKYLSANDTKDKTERPTDWTKEKERRNAIGGPYLSVHLRRRDFLYGHAASVPSIKHAASQLQRKLHEMKLNKLFVATDAQDAEYNELVEQLSDYEVLRYKPTKHLREKLKDGGIAIIDQIICSYSRYFIGTYESTFTFRIQEDREIIGFPAHSTFNYLCGEEKCFSSNTWEIIWQ